MHKAANPSRLKVILLAISFGVQAFAVSWTDLGNYSTSWYDTNSAAIRFTINTAADLAGLAVLVNGGNTFLGKTVMLSTNVDLTGKEWAAIGTSSRPFKGLFNGKGNSITGVNIVNKAADNQGFFGYIDEGTVMNVGLFSISVIGKDYVGGIAGCNCYGAVQNCAVNGAISGSRYVGGVLGGTSFGMVHNCLVNGSVTGESSLGGLIGLGGGQVQSCYWKKTGISPYSLNAIGLTTSPNSFTNLLFFSAATPMGTVTLSGAHTSYETNDLLTVLNSFVAEYRQDDCQLWAAQADTVPTLTATIPSPVAQWQDFANTSWYTENTSAPSYVLTTPQDLAGLAKLVNEGIETFNGKVIYLGSGVSLAGKRWTPIGDSVVKSFRGVFDGAGYCVADCSLVSTHSYRGLFGYIYGVNAMVQNLILTNMLVTGGTRSGGVVGGCNQGTVKNCSAIGTMSGGSSVGGLVGYNLDGLVQGCIMNGETLGGSEVGGVVGSISSKGTLQNSTTYGNVTGFGRIGGVAGANLGMIRNCIAKANVAAITISAGGIVGEIFNGGTVQNCAVYGNVSGKQEIGGIVGYHNGVINNCAVNGGVTGNAEVGGVVGHRSNSTSSTVKSCYWKKTGSEPFNQNAVGFGMTSDGPLTNLISFSTITPLGEVTLSTVHSVYATSDLLTVLNAWVSENQMTTNAILNWWKIVPDNIPSPLLLPVVVTFNASGGTFRGGHGVSNVVYAGTEPYNIFPEEPARNCYAFSTWTNSMGEVVTTASPAIAIITNLWANWSQTHTTNSLHASVPFDWIRAYYPNEGDPESKANTYGENGILIWHSFVAGLTPTNPLSQLLVNITCSNGTAHITWNPNLLLNRKYTVLGKLNLADETWGTTNAATRFFKVKVEIP